MGHGTVKHLSTGSARAGDSAYGTDGKVNITVTVPVELRDGMQRVATANDRTLSHEIRRVLRKHIEAHDKAA